MSEPKPRRQRGVRLSDLDRSRVYRIGFTGRRWEVLDAGTSRADAAAAPGARSESARPEAARPDHAPGRHRAPHAGPDETAPASG